MKFFKNFKDKRTSVSIGSRTDIAFMILMNVVFLLSQILAVMSMSCEYATEVLTSTANMIFYSLFFMFTAYCFAAMKYDQYFIFTWVCVIDVLPRMKFLLQKEIQNLHFFTNLIPVYTIIATVTAGVIILLATVVRRNSLMRKGAVIFLIFFYAVESFSAWIEHPHSSINRVNSLEPSTQTNLFVLLFDEYPAFEICHKYLHFSNEEIHRFLLKNKFSTINTFSNFTNTEKSLPSLLTGHIDSQVNVNATIESLRTNVFTAAGIRFNVHSIFDDNNRPNSLTATEFFRNINNLSIRYIIPFAISLFDKRGNGVFYNIDAYHQRGLDSLSKWVADAPKGVSFIHFYAPHKYPSVEHQSFIERIVAANKLMTAAVTIILKQQANASIVILSDHGLRDVVVPKNDWNKNLLYYRNYNFDTMVVRREGSVRLFQ